MHHRLRNRATPFSGGWRVHLGALLAFFALLTQSLVPSLPMPAAAMMAAGTAAGTLCLNGGDHSTQQKKDAPGHKSVPCPICLAFHLMGSLLTPAPLAIAFPRAIGPPSAAHDLQELYRLAVVTNQARGPPSSF